MRSVVAVGKGPVSLGRHKAKATRGRRMDTRGSGKAEQVPMPELTTQGRHSLASIFRYSVKNQGTKIMTSHQQSARLLLTSSARAFPFYIPLLQACASHFSSWSRLQALVRTSMLRVFLSASREAAGSVLCASPPSTTSVSPQLLFLPSVGSNN